VLLCQVPVIEGKEPPCFVRLFNGHMIIHTGKRDEAVNHRWRLYVLRNELPMEAYLWQIPAECQNLRSRASFVLVDCEKSVLYVWHGAKSSFQTKQRVIEIANWIVKRYHHTIIFRQLLVATTATATSAVRIFEIFVSTLIVSCYSI